MPNVETIGKLIAIHDCFSRLAPAIDKLTVKIAPTTCLNSTVQFRCFAPKSAILPKMSVKKLAKKQTEKMAKNEIILFLGVLRISVPLN